MTAVLATTFSSMSGGGSSVIAIPIFLSMGIPFPMATAMQQLNSTFLGFAFPWILFAALILILKGYFDLSLMIPAALGSLTGGYMGSKFARLKGNRFIKMVFTISGIILGLKLLLGL